MNVMKKLEKMVRDRLNWDNRIDVSQIEVSVINGVATLKGCVFTYPEKVLAEIETQMLPEIESVVNNIETIFHDSYKIPSDQDLNDAMFCLLDANSEIEPSDVKVTINNGNVVLKGKVNSYWKADKIKEMVSNISGVISVVNNISIVPEEKMSDDEIANSIVVSMQNSVHVDAHKIDIKVDDKIVTLSGIVSSMNEYEAALDIVKSTKGVIDIVNDLKWVLRYHTT